MDAMQQELKAFKDPALARGLIESIQALAPESATLMEVCGTHTVAIARNGIRGLMPEGVRLASGPGCPVCLTSNHDIDKVIALARVPEVTIATFGDMTRVPGSTSSLLAEQAAGRAVEIVYSPLDALRLAQENPTRQIVFVGVGFETTTPLVAMAIKRARAMGLTNFTVYGAHKNMPGALEVIINDPEEILDETRIIERDLTDYYQGDYIWLIPRKNEYYDEPTVVDCVFCYVKYGSCCGCDTLMGIYEGFGEDNQWGEGLLPSERRVKDYMYLSLQLLQNMKPLMTLEEARQNYEIKYEDYMK